MRGFEIVFSRHFDLVRYLALDNLELSDYTFYCIDVLAYYNSKAIQLKKILTFKQLVNLSKSKIIVERLNLQAYPKGTSPILINTHADFLLSPCDMVILAYDGVFLEIYAKNQYWLNKLLNNLDYINTRDIVIKTQETDGRVGLYV